MIDADSRRALANVNIFVQGRRIGTTTDRDGRFRLPARLAPEDTLVFSHIGYHLYKCPVARLRRQPLVKLVPRAILFPGLQVEAERASRAARDLPAMVSLVPVDGLISEGAVDLGDFLVRKASVAVEETAAGQKFISVRGGNADEVMVVYDGIRLNSANTNLFDLAQIDLGGLERVELVKGSNTVLFGDGAFGGVLNIVPRKHSEHALRTVARVGTYSAREVALDFYRSRGHFDGGYSFSLRNSERAVDGRQAGLFNENQFHTLWARYAARRRQVQARVIFSTAGFNDKTLTTHLENSNRIGSILMETRAPLLQTLRVRGVLKQLEGETRWPDPASGGQNRELSRDHSMLLHVESDHDTRGVKWTLVYERSEMAFRGTLIRPGVAEAPGMEERRRLRRWQDSFFGIIKNRLDVGHAAMRYIDWDLSFRIDWAETRREVFDSGGAEGEPFRAETGRKSYLTYKFGMRWLGRIAGVAYNLFVANGANVKLPTLQQLFHKDTQPLFDYREPPLAPERNIGSEVGVKLRRDFHRPPRFFPIERLNGEFALFRNSYLEKITEMANIVPIPTPFNTSLAWTRGMEASVAGTFFHGRLKVEGEALFLNISDPRVFRFKPRQKWTADLWYTTKNWRFNIHLLSEGTQFAMIPALGEVASRTLPGRWDVDLALRRRWKKGKFSGFVNFALRNLRNGGREKLSGLYLRDRRWMLALGVEL